MSAGDLITQAGQLQFRDLLLGMGTDYDLTDLAGWEDMPPVDVGSKTRPRQHGADPSRMLAQPQALTATFDIDPQAGGGTAAARAFLRSRTGLPVDALQEPIAVSLDPGVFKIRYGQLTARKIPIKINYENIIKDAVLQWQCADPRLYSSTLQTVTAKLPVADPGSGSGVYPQNYPFNYAGLILGGGPQPATNNGNAETPPVYTITGPITNPAITITDATGSRSTTFGMSLAATDSLVIDVLNKTVKLGAASRYGYSTGAPIESLSLAPGTSTVSLTGTGDATTTMTVAFRDADI